MVDDAAQALSVVTTMIKASDNVHLTISEDIDPDDLRAHERAVWLSAFCRTAAQGWDKKNARYAAAVAVQLLREHIADLKVKKEAP